VGAILLRNNTSKMILRIVIPARDMDRVKKFVDDLKNSGINPVVSKRQKIFENRPDLDVIELIYILYLTPVEEKGIRKQLSKMLSGTIGFFLLYGI